MAKALIQKSGTGRTVFTGEMTFDKEHRKSVFRKLPLTLIQS